MNVTEAILQVLDKPDGEFIDRLEIIDRLKKSGYDVVSGTLSNIPHRLNALAELYLVEFGFSITCSYKKVWRKTWRGEREMEVLAELSKPLYKEETSNAANQ